MSVAAHASLDDIAQHLDGALRTSEIPDYPGAMNGIQVEHEGPVTRCAVAVDASVQTLMVCNAVGYGVGISARNAGRPLIAIGQLVLAIAPVIIALLIGGGVAHLVLALSMVMLLPAMVSIILNTFRIVRDSVGSAETSARLAAEMQILARTDVGGRR